MLFFVWIICAAAAVIIASGKGRSGCAFFAISLISGPLALIIALVMNTDPAKAVEDGIDRGDLKICPACREAIKAKASICPRCRTAQR